MPLRQQNAYRTPAPVLAWLTVASIVLAATPSESTGEESRPALDVHITPFPYNTDPAGHDLPTELGKFTVRLAQDGHDVSGETEVGFVRYTGNSASSTQAIFSLSARPSPSTFLKDLYQSLGANVDVIEFSLRGHGFSSPMATCPDRLKLPLDEPLDRESLTLELANVLAQCQAKSADLFQISKYFQYSELSSDLVRLAEFLEYKEIILVADQLTSSIALATADEHPDLIRKVILANSTIPKQHEDRWAISALLNDHSGRTDPDAASLAELYRNLSVILDQSPITLSVSSESGRTVDVTVGTLDLDFIVRRHLRREAGGIGQLGSLLYSANHEDYSQLGLEALRARAWLAEISIIQILDEIRMGAFSTAEKESNLEYALSWPISAANLVDVHKLYENRTNTFINSTVLYLAGTSEYGYSPSRIRQITSRFRSSMNVTITCENRAFIDTIDSVTKIVTQFVLREQTEHRGISIDDCD